MECRLFQSWPRFPPDSERNFPSKLPFSLLAPSCPFSTNHARSQRGDHDSVTHIRVSIAMEERGPRELKRGLRISWSIRTRNRYRVAQLSGSVTILIGSRYFVVWDRSWGKFGRSRFKGNERIVGLEILLLRLPSSISGLVVLSWTYFRGLIALCVPFEANE